jgi:acyl-CoA synthetase (AMP-forming)/AMP-acid ligase II
MSEHPAESAPQPSYVDAALAFFAQMDSAEAIVHEDRRYTYAEVRAAVLAMASALTANGVRGGMTVVAVTGNHPEGVILQLALHLLGCRTGFVANWAPRQDQLSFLACADVLIHDSGLADDLIGDALAQAERPVLSLGPEDGRPDLLVAMVVAAAAGQLPSAAAAGAEPQALFYTSGTTGRPKLVLHGQRFYQALFLGGQFYRASGEPAMRHMSTQNFAMTAMQMPVLLALFQGGTAILTSSPPFAEFIGIIERERVTSVFLTPLRLGDLLDEPALAAADVSSLRYLNCGGAAAPPAILARAIERLGPVVRIVYGMMELPLITDYPFLTIDPERPDRLRSCGKPFADARIEVRDEQGNVLPTGETGEVWATGTLVMDEYAGQPELTRAALVDGWLRTEDVGYTDSDGFLYLVDRARDIVITTKRTVKVYSRMVEDVLVTHPGVRAAAVIGTPDEELGEAVTAFVVAAPGASVTAAELRELVASELKDPWVPRDVEFIGELPMTPADKVDKKALRARYQA